MFTPLQSEKKVERKSIGRNDPFYGQPNGILLDDKQWLYIQRRYHISPRELEVTKLVCQGFTNGDIAKRLKVKPGTVKTHLRSIFNKTRVRNKITMLLRCMENAGELARGINNVVPIATLDVQNPVRKNPALSEIQDEEK